MYNELFEIWRNELKSDELTELPTDFAQKVADYLKRISGEHKMLDKKNVKASLLEKEKQNVKRILKELMIVRFKKLAKKAGKGEKKLHGLLSFEEEALFKLASSLESYEGYVREMLHGRNVKAKSAGKFIALRFLKEVPEIVGLDMKVYGPFKAEDIAVLPVENAKILVKQGLASEIEIG
jgi:DNA replication factor GINS